MLWCRTVTNFCILRIIYKIHIRSDLRSSHEGLMGLACWIIEKDYNQPCACSLHVCALILSMIPYLWSCNVFSGSIYLCFFCLDRCPHSLNSSFVQSHPFLPGHDSLQLPFHATCPLHVGKSCINASVWPSVPVRMRVDEEEDETIARRLQREELGYDIVPRRNSLAQGRPVQVNLAEDLSAAQSNSPRVMALFVFLWVLEVYFYSIKMLISLVDHLCFDSCYKLEQKLWPASEALDRFVFLSTLCSCSIEIVWILSV